MTAPQFNRIAAYAATGLLALEGVALLIVSPLLLFLGGWGGADYGGVWYGIGNVLGVPWLLFAVCALLSIRWLRRRRAFPACLVALVPLLAVGAMVWRTGVR